MATKYAQPGDYDNTLLGKMLENDTQVIGQTLSYSVAAGTATATPRYAYPGDDKNTLLRKILENQSRVIAGTLTMAIA